MHGNGMCLTTSTVNLRHFLCNLPIRFDLAQAINRCIDTSVEHISNLLHPTPSQLPQRRTAESRPRGNM
jgi:hypothetical protein